MQAKKRLIRMQLAYRKVDIDILFLNFVIYVDTLQLATQRHKHIPAYTI